MKVVLDTNVLVAGLLTPHGPPGRVMDLVLRGDVIPCLDDRILGEYRDVLARPKFAFDEDDVDALLDYLRSESVHVVAAPLRVALPDPEDLMFLEVAFAAGADGLVTGNLRHFPARKRVGVRVVTPRQFIDLYNTSPPAG